MGFVPLDLIFVQLSETCKICLKIYGILERKQLIWKAWYCNRAPLAPILSGGPLYHPLTQIVNSEAPLARVL